MPTNLMRISVFQAIATLALLTAHAAAQQSVRNVGGLVYGLVGGGFGDGTFVATGAGAGLRLTSHLGLDLELTHLSDSHGAGLAAGSSVRLLIPVIVFPGESLENFRDPQRDLATFLTRFTVEVPVANGRLFPYLTGGGGVERVTASYSIAFSPFPTFSEHPRAELGRSLVLGGLEVQLWRGFGVGVDIHWQRILRRYDALDTAQAISQVSSQF